MAALKKASKMMRVTTAASEVNEARLLDPEEETRRKGPDVAASAEEEKEKETVTAAQVMQQMRMKSRYLIDPRSSKAIQAWDIITTVALMFIALVTPFEVSFLPAAESATPLFIVNRLLDVIFTVDLVLNFFIVQETFDAEYGLRWIDDHGLIVRHCTRAAIRTPGFERRCARGRNTITHACLDEMCQILDRGSLWTCSRSS